MFDKELEIFEEEKQEDIVELPEKERRRLRRRNNIRKALRKRRLAKQLYQIDYYGSLHQFSKNKIHCSCSMCRPQGISHSDAKKLASTNEQLSDD